jgi:hypothetical protein
MPRRELKMMEPQSVASRWLSSHPTTVVRRAPLPSESDDDDYEEVDVVDAIDATGATKRPGPNGTGYTHTHTHTQKTILESAMAAATYGGATHAHDDAMRDGGASGHAHAISVPWITAATCWILVLLAVVWVGSRLG